MSRKHSALHQLDKLASNVGTLQAKIRLLIDTAPAELRESLTTAADHLDAADEALTKCYCQTAPVPAEYLKMDKALSGNGCQMEGSAAA